VILLVLGIARLGRLIQFIPHPVTTGFTAGIGVVIAVLQLEDFFGLHVAKAPEHFHERVAELWSALPTLAWPEFSIGAFTLVVLIAWPKLTKRLPGPLIAMTLGAVVAWLCARYVPGFGVETIGSRFSYEAGGQTFAGIPRTPPALAWPWSHPGPDGQPIGISFGLLRALLGPALAIAALGAIESLLCAVVADGMAGTRHDSDAELAAQGVGNIVAPFFGGIAATGAIARTATSIRAGSRSPIAAIVHALFVLFAVLALAPLLAYLPMASLAALLLIVAWNMSEARHFVHIVRVAPKSDVLVLLTCFSLTVGFDMVVSVSVGIVLAALLFMRSMSEMFSARPAERDHPHLRDPQMQDVVFYEIAGPLFFGAAEKAVSTLAPVGGKARAVILQMDAVPVMDISGLVALETAIDKLHHQDTFVVLAGVQKQPRAVLHKAGVREEAGKLAICADDDEALLVVKLYLGMLEPAAGAGSAPSLPAGSARG
jgi:SulP family sulfate permease